jgi:hypothetical protein
VKSQAQRGCWSATTQKDYAVRGAEQTQTEPGFSGGRNGASWMSTAVSSAAGPTISIPVRLQVTSLLDGLAECKSNPKLAGELGLNRTTVYYLRRELEEAGFVWTDGGSKGQIRPGARQEPAVGTNNGRHGQEGGR